MIKTFKHKGLEKFFYDGTTKGIQVKHAEKIADILDLLDAADTIQVMNFPGSRLIDYIPKRKTFGPLTYQVIGELLSTLLVETHILLIMSITIS